MFTGLIEEIGTVRAIKQIGSGRRITIEAADIRDGLKIDDSVSLNGVCQTVVALTGRTFDVEAVEETLIKTTFSKLRPGMKINLECAAKLGDRLGGHLVQGHVDCTGAVLSIRKKGSEVLIWISFPDEFSKYIVPAGSISVDGVSLTAARVDGSKFMVSIIPHTWELTTLSGLRVGGEVNLEFDIIGKYVAKIINPNAGSSSAGASILEQYLDQPE